MLQFVLQVSQPTSPDPLQEFELIPNLSQSRVPLKAILVRNQKLGSLFAAEEGGDEFLNECIWNQPNDDCNRKRDHANDQTDSPLRTVYSGDREGMATNKNDQDLPTHDDELDSKEPPIAEHAFKDIETIVQAARVPLVEDLHPNEGIEYNCREYLAFVTEVASCKVQDKRDGHLIDTLAEDHFPHCEGDKRRGFGFGSAVKNMWRGRISR